MIQDTLIYLKNARRMNKNLIHVESHVTDIPERLKEINPYFITMFNPKTQQFEVHRLDVAGHTLELNIPYTELDERAIRYAVHAREVEKVRKEVEENNAKLDREKREAAENVQKCKTRDLFDYCNRHMDKETFDDNAYSTRWV